MITKLGTTICYKTIKSKMKEAYKLFKKAKNMKEKEKWAGIFNYYYRLYKK